MHTRGALEFQRSSIAAQLEAVLLALCNGGLTRFCLLGAQSRQPPARHGAAHRGLQAHGSDPVRTCLPLGGALLTKLLLTSFALRDRLCDLRTTTAHEASPAALLTRLLDAPRAPRPTSLVWLLSFASLPQLTS